MSTTENRDATVTTTPPPPQAWLGNWRTRRYWRVREHRQDVYQFAPYASTALVRFFIQRPSGYMSVYSLRSALRSVRAARRRDGWRDPLYVSFYGGVPVRLPALRGPVRPRKSPLRYGTPAEQARCHRNDRPTRP